jgi:glyoxylase-like metal-dependent hydrolase (beta-lactamase superfamily II)
MEEITFSDDEGLRIERFQAYDFGTMEFLPGHAIGHMCALARTSERSFVLLGADACHFAGALRSSRYLPMPDTLDAEASRLDLGFQGSASVWGIRRMSSKKKRREEDELVLYCKQGAWGRGY